MAFKKKKKCKGKKGIQNGGQNKMKILKMRYLKKEAKSGKAQIHISFRGKV